MTDGQQLAAVAVPPAETSVTDRAGNPLSSYNDWTRVAQVKLGPGL